MIAWLMLLNNNPNKRQENDQAKFITQAYDWINLIVSIIDESEQKLNEEKREIENMLMS
jgi:hypothetical protein